MYLICTRREKAYVVLTSFSEFFCAGLLRKKAFGVLSLLYELFCINARRKKARGVFTHVKPYFLCRYTARKMFLI